VVAEKTAKDATGYLPHPVYQMYIKKYYRYVTDKQ